MLGRDLAMGSNHKMKDIKDIYGELQVPHYFKGFDIFVIS